MRLEMVVGFAIRDGNFLFLKNGWCRIKDTEVFEFEREQLFSDEEIERELEKVKVDASDLIPNMQGLEQYELRIVRFSYIIKDVVGNGMGTTEEPPYNTYEEIPKWLKINKETRAARSLTDFINAFENFLNPLGQRQLAWVQDIINDYIQRGMTLELDNLQNALATLELEDCRKHPSEM